jgi:hypothetical protein
MNITLPQDLAEELEKIAGSKKKSDILLDLFGVAWMPYYLVKAGEQVLELRGFSPK